MKKQILKKYLNELFSKTSNKYEEKLWYGVPISIEEYIKFIGGTSKFKETNEMLKRLIENEVKKNIKKGYEIGIKIDKWETTDKAFIRSLKPLNIFVEYSLIAIDDTGHSLVANYRINFAKTKIDSFVEVGG